MNQSSFDNKAATWDKKKTRQDLAYKASQAILDYLPVRSHWKVMDYGCGTGLLTLQIRPHVRQIWAADNSVGMLEVLAGKLCDNDIKNVYPWQCDLSLTSGVGKPLSQADKILEPESLDLIISSMALHHVHDIAALFAGFDALLRPGGYLGLVDLQPEDGSFHDHAEDIAHHGFARNFLFALAKAHWKDLRYIPFHSIAKQREQGIDEYGIFLFRAQK